jgi:hypothetical protein
MSWERGRADVEDLLSKRELEKVPPSPELGARLLEDAAQHIESAKKIAESDPAGAYSMAYDGARKASAALLAIEGLRATSSGGHIAIQDAVEAQFNGRGGHPAFKEFKRLRRTRNAREYPDIDSPDTTTDDAIDAIDTANAIVKAAEQIGASGKLSPFV